MRCRINLQLLPPRPLNLVLEIFAFDSNNCEKSIIQSFIRFGLFHSKNLSLEYVVKTTNENERYCYRLVLDDDVFALYGGISLIHTSKRQALVYSALLAGIQLFNEYVFHFQFAQSTNNLILLGQIESTLFSFGLGQYVAGLSDKTTYQLNLNDYKTWLSTLVSLKKELKVELCTFENILIKTVNTYSKSLDSISQASETSIERAISTPKQTTPTTTAPKANPALKNQKVTHAALTNIKEVTNTPVSQTPPQEDQDSPFAGLNIDAG